MLKEIHFNQRPPCWESCGICAEEALEVLEVSVGPGARLRPYDPILELETGKTTLELTTPAGGTVAAVLVEVGDWIREGELLLLLDPD